jgi:nucleotide-binding universal stress UspA family protein
MTRVILFATDFSGRCDRARDRAVRLARRWGARLILLHVWNPAPEEDASDEGVEHARLVAKLRAEINDKSVDVEARVASGNVADAIVEAASEGAVDLVVTGLSQVDELSDFLVGTTVERVLRHAGSPVLVVKEPPRGDYGQIMVATDFSDCAQAALEVAGALFTDANFTLVHAYHINLEALRGKEEPAAVRQVEIAAELDAFLQRIRVPADVRERLEINVDYGDVCAVARDHVRSSGVDLAVLGTHGRSGIVDTLIGSTARALLACLECDVLLIKDDERA